ncbi:MAG: DUF1800 family protein [Pseudomonadota bacterium]
MNQIESRKRRGFLVGSAAAVAGGSLPVAAGAAKPAEGVVAPTGGSINRLSAAVSKGLGSTGVIEPPFAVKVLNKIGFGPARRNLGFVEVNSDVILETGFERRSSNFATQDDVSHFLALGSNDNERLNNFVEEQLNPLPEDPDLQARLASAPGSFDTLGLPLATVWSERECEGFSAYSRPYFETERFMFNAAAYSRWQLYYQMVDFWSDHLNIFGRQDEDIYVSWSSWNRDVLRTYALGNFYDLIIASAKHPAMLRYLDNYVNGRGGAINENYCRELFELHCMGAENYAGNEQQFDVEALSENPYTALNDSDLRNFGNLDAPTTQIARFYVDDDVLTAAQSMTGWRYEDENQGGSCGTGAFITDEQEHNSDSTKAVLTLGTSRIPSNLDAETEGRLIVKLAAYHPGTANYIARKLCTRLVSDDPPQSLIDKASATFFAHRKSGDQIKRTLRTILTSDEFKASLQGEKVKRPFEYVVSAMRAAGTDYTIRMSDRTSDEFIGRYNNTGQRLFDWRTPDGYPDTRGHWEGSNNLVQCWRTIDWLLDKDYRDDQDRVTRVLDITLDNVVGNPTPRQLVEFWCNWILGFSPAGGWTGPEFTPYQNAPTAVGGAALQFLTQQGFGGFGGSSGQNADAPLQPSDEPINRNSLQEDNSPDYWHRRILGMVKVILWSPQFMQR